MRALNKNCFGRAQFRGWAGDPVFGGAQGDRMTSAILLAPFLKYNAPTMRPNAGGWSRPLVRRFIGLSLLNAVGVTVLNHLTVLQFAFPEFVLNTVHKVALTRAYTYRMNLSY